MHVSETLQNFQIMFNTRILLYFLMKQFQMCEFFYFSSHSITPLLIILVLLVYYYYHYYHHYYSKLNFLLFFPLSAPSRDTDRPKPWEEEEFDRSSIYRSSGGKLQYYTPPPLNYNGIHLNTSQLRKNN